MPSWVGKIVAPGQNECPWMQSSAVSSGMPEPGPRGQVDGPDHGLGRGVQDRAGQLGRDDVVQVPLGVELQHLPDLLGQGHPTEQVLDPLLDAGGSR